MFSRVMDLAKMLSMLYMMFVNVWNVLKMSLYKDV